MLRDDILALLRRAEGGYLSGEAMSQTLGVSRAAVWKAVSSLRADGYAVSSSPNRGYRLDSSPDLLDAAALTALLPPEFALRSIHCLEEVDSTNNACRRLAADGAEDGTIVVAGRQTAGRGRGGRTFVSPAGGLYLSMLLRPKVPPMQALSLTAWAAVAVCDAVESLCALRPSIKWTNDVLLQQRKLCGILTEMGLQDSGELDYVVVGIGVNLRSGLSDLDPSLAGKAISLEEVLPAPPRRDAMAAALILALEDLRASFPRAKGRYLAAYRRDCVTTGREVTVLRPGQPPRAGRALEVDDGFRLVVDFGAGPEPVESGEVSVRGLEGYV